MKKIYGPYTRKDGRKYILIYENGKCRTVSYPKYLIETNYNIILKENETVDHIDRNFNNNDLNNLQILTRDVHSKLDAIHVKLPLINCLWCNKNFILSKKQIRSKKAGPFCSRSCVGKYGAEKQNCRIEKLDRIKFDIEYFRFDKTSL